MTLEERAQAIADICLTTWRGEKRRKAIYARSLQMLREVAESQRSLPQAIESRQTSFTCDNSEHHHHR